MSLSSQKNHNTLPSVPQLLSMHSTNSSIQIFIHDQNLDAFFPSTHGDVSTMAFSQEEMMELIAITWDRRILFSVDVMN